MFYLVLEFAMQLGLLCLLLVAFIVAQVMLSTTSTGSEQDMASDEMEEPSPEELPQNRNPVSERRAVSTRSQRPVASLATVRMRPGQEQAKPIFGRKASA